MDQSFVFKTLYIFLTFLQIFLYLYLVVTFFPFKESLKKKMLILVWPVILPVRKLLLKSVFMSSKFDWSPVIVIFMLIYIKSILEIAL